MTERESVWVSRDPAPQHHAKCESCALGDPLLTATDREVAYRFARHAGRSKEPS